MGSHRHRKYFNLFNKDGSINWIIKRVMAMAVGLAKSDSIKEPHQRQP